MYVCFGTALVRFFSLLHLPATPTSSVLSVALSSSAGQLKLQDRGVPAIIKESCVTATTATQQQEVFPIERVEEVLGFVSYFFFFFVLTSTQSVLF